MRSWWQKKKKKHTEDWVDYHNGHCAVTFAVMLMEKKMGFFKNHQEIRLTDLAPIQMEASSYHCFLNVQSCNVFALARRPHPLPPPPSSLSLLLSRSLSLSSPPPTSPSLVFDVFSLHPRRQFSYRITTRIRWPGFDSPSKPPHRKWKCIHVCWMLHIMRMWAVYAFWKWSAIALCYSRQTMWLQPLNGEISVLLFFLSFFPPTVFSPNVFIWM